MTKLIPLHDRIAIEPMETEEKTVGGIIIPDTAKEKPTRGKVVAVGSGTKDQNGNLCSLTLKVGDIVLYGKWGGTQIDHDGLELVIMKESDVLAIVS